MRASLMARWLCAVTLSCVCGLARADEPAVRIEIQGAQTLQRSAHALVPVVLALSVPDDTPLMLTPSVEGAAVEVVRGRLLRSEATVIDASHLRFDVPVVARSEGTAILRVEVATYVCRPGCRPIAASALRVLRVR